MQINSTDIEFLVGSSELLSNMTDTPALSIFSELVEDFLVALSKKILGDKSARSFPDVISYGYWIRKASIENAKKKFTDAHCRLGRGVAFHIAPSNVPVNFAVSMTYSLLSGNCTVVRVSSKLFKQTEIICCAINSLLEDKFSAIKPYLCVIRYEHSETVTAQLTDICDVRIIWGGNRTISEIRKAQLPPRAIELAFADRHSIALIDSDEYMKTDPKETAKKFYTDTYYTDQNACSSPRLVVWIGNSISEARTRFWSHLHKLVKDDYALKPIQAVEKLLSLCLFSATGQKAKLVSTDNYIVRIEVEQLTSWLMDYKDNSGYFFEYVADDLKEIIPVLTKSCQTVAVLGIPSEDIYDIVVKSGVKGVDRIVSMGMTMGIEYIWDSFDMIRTMSRIVYY